MNCGCSNSGCGCRNGTIATLPNGNTFHVRLKLRDNWGESVLPDGFGIVVGFYGKRKRLLLRAGTDDGRVKYNANSGFYEMTVSHEESLLMEGLVFVELTLTYTDVKNGGGMSIYHGDKVVAVVFEPRKNNDILEM